MKPFKKAGEVNGHTVWTTGVDPFSTKEEIEAALFELLAEKVLYIDGDSLCQKRMIEDNHISQVRSKAGKTNSIENKSCRMEVMKVTQKEVANG